MSTAEQGVKIVAKSKGQVGKSKLVVVFLFLEANATKPSTGSCTRSSRASGKHYICQQMALSESGCRAATGVGIPTNSGYTDYFQDSVFLLSSCCDFSQNKLFHVLSKPRCWFLELVLGISLKLYYKSLQKFWSAMQANFQLLAGDSAIGGGLQLPVRQSWTADNIVDCDYYWL